MKDHGAPTEIMMDSSGVANRSKATPAASGGSSRRRSRASEEGWSKTSHCRICRDGTLVRAHRETFGDFVLSFFGLYPFVCTNCHEQSHRIRPKQLAGAICVTAVTLVLLGFAGKWLHSAYQARMLHREGLVGLPTFIPAAPAPTPAAAPPPKAADTSIPSGAEFLTNQDVAKMVKAGMSSTLICNLISHMGNRFKVDADSLSELTNAGTPQSVITAMTDAAKTSQGQ